VGVERFRDDGVRPRAVGAGPVERLEGAGQHDDRDVRTVRQPLDGLAELVPRETRHHGVGENHVGREIRKKRRGLVAASHRPQLPVRSGKRELDDLLDRQTVVR